MNHESPPSDRPRAARRDWLFRSLLAAAFLGLYLVGTAGMSVLDRDEARFALAVKEMSASGDWLIPSNFGEPRYNKPILSYWLALASTRILGMNETALRLPSALCGVVTVLLTMAIAGRLAGRRVGRMAGVILGTALYMAIESRFFTADASLLAATTISFGAWLRLRDRPVHPGRWQFLLWMSVGVGLLAKVVNVAFLGFAACALSLLEGRWPARVRHRLACSVLVGALAVALPGFGALGPFILGTLAVVFLVNSMRSDEGRRAWRHLGAPWGIPLALTVFLAWALPAALVTQGQFAVQGLGHHLLQRTVTPFEGHAGWPGYYLVMTLVAFFPWGSLLPAALGDAWRRRRDAEGRFLLAWILGPLVLVELTTSKLPHYLLIAFPALAVLVAMLIDARMTDPHAWTKPVRRGESGFLALLCIGAAIAVARLPLALDTPATRIAAVAMAAGFLAVAITSALCGLRGQPRSLLASLACGAALLYVLAATVLLPALEPLRLGPRLGDSVAQQLRPNERLVLCGLHDASIAYYLPRSPDIVGDPARVADALRTTTGQALILMPENDARCLALLRSSAGGSWNSVGITRGLILPGLSERGVRIVRGTAMTADRL